MNGQMDRVMKGGVACHQGVDEKRALVVLTVVAHPHVMPLCVWGSVSSYTPLFCLFCFPS